MSKVNSLLSQRLKAATQKLSKMTGLAELSSSGNLSSFAGVFRVTPLTEKEKEKLEEILASHKNNHRDIDADLKDLSNITSEVKAINNQAAILHGERIKKAQEILTQYQDGAFTAWLIAAYGNRQTPYNFLQYYELHLALPHALHAKLDEMPRQAVYTLAARNVPLEQKEEIIKNYSGEPKSEILSKIRQSFPLAAHDKRAEDLAQQAIAYLKQAVKATRDPRFRPSKEQRQTLSELLEKLRI